MTTAMLPTPATYDPLSSASSMDFLEVEPTSPATAKRDAEFEREALPWLDDVYRFAHS
ncbi:MAG: hypothetical protein JWM95_4069, partial [Gemmatimonadetes bacterium]|nr:hypothetical protein [Gemmatimonadota bacterium]